MSKAFKIALILLICASVSSAILAVLAFLEKEKEHTRRRHIEDRLAIVLKDKDILEKENKDSKAKISRMQQDIEKFLSQIEDEKDRNKSLSMDLAGKRKDIEKLKLKLDEEKKARLIVSKRFEDLKFKYEEEEKNILKINKEKTKLEKRVNNLKRMSVDIGKIVVNPSVDKEISKQREPIKIEKELLKGNVIVVNRDYNFVLVDLGRIHGVKDGMLFDIKDTNGQFLEKAEIDKVYDDMSSATILPPAEHIYNIKKGDLIIESP